MMPRYHFRALDKQQHLVTGEIDAADPDALLRQLQQDGLEVLQVRRRRFVRRPHLSRRDLIDLCCHLEHLLSAGITLLDALQDLAEHSESRTLRPLSRQLASRLRHGQSLSAALHDSDERIDSAFAGAIRAGESSGQLPEILRRLASHLQQSEEQSAQARLALLYPLLAGSIVIAASAFLLVVLVPQIRNFLADSGLPTPPHTQLLFWLADFLNQYWPHLLTLPLLAFLAVALGRQQPALQIRLDRLRLNLPWLGNIERKMLTASLGRLLALLYASGIPLLDALRLLEESSSNRLVRRAMQQVHQQVAQGSSLAAAFAAHAFFPPQFIRMLSIGENSGALDQALDHAVYRHEREAREMIARLHKLLEPLLTLLIGILLGWIMLSILQPIYNMVGQAGR